MKNQGLRRALYILDMSQSDLAKALGIYPASVSRWLSGAVKVPIHHALTIEAMTKEKGEKVSRRELIPSFPWGSDDED